MYLVCAVLFIATAIGLVLGYRRLQSRAELERAEALLASEIDALDCDPCGGASEQRSVWGRRGS